MLTCTTFCAAAQIARQAIPVGMPGELAGSEGVIERRDGCRIVEAANADIDVVWPSVNGARRLIFFANASPGVKLTASFEIYDNTTCSSIGTRAYLPSSALHAKG